MNGLSSEHVIRLSHDSLRLDVAARVTTSLSLSVSLPLSPVTSLSFIPICCPRRSSMREMRVRNTLGCWLSPFFHPLPFFRPSFSISLSALPCNSSFIGTSPFTFSSYTFVFTPPLILFNRKDKTTYLNIATVIINPHFFHRRKRWANLITFLIFLFIRTQIFAK